MTKHLLKMTLVAFVLIASLQGQQTIDPRTSTPEIREIESRNYSQFAYLTPLPDLQSLPQNASKDPIVVAYSPREHNNIGGASTDPNSWLQTLIANSDAVLVGRPYNRISALTAEKTFVFSDYEFIIEDVLKDKSKHLSANSQIVVTRPGGLITYESKSFRAIDSEFQLFRLGDIYLLFLHRIPETGTYLVTAERAFSIKDGNVLSAKRNPRFKFQDIHRDTVTSLIKGYVSKEDEGR